MTAEARAILESRRYPGNARDLNAVLAAAAALAGPDPISADDVPAERKTTPTPLRQALKEFERAAIDRALVSNKGDLTATAKELGISRRALKRKLDG